MDDLYQHNYYKKLLNLIEEGKLAPDCLNVVNVYHDEWCCYNRGGYCNCDPDLKPRPRPELN